MDLSYISKHKAFPHWIAKLYIGDTSTTATPQVRDNLGQNLFRKTQNSQHPATARPKLKVHIALFPLASLQSLTAAISTVIIQYAI